MDLTFLQIILMLGSFLLTFQGILTLIWMLYAWESPRLAKKRRSPRRFAEPAYSFTALVPMRHEEKVAIDTIKAISRINYPDKLKEIIIICRHDDNETINKVQEVISEIDNGNNSVIVLVDSYPINKPLSLNQGLLQARNQIVTIFDAEDEPHPEIYNIVNTIMIKKGVDVVQSGVQLMNYNSHWFSALNAMEYYLWFKSGLHFFTDVGNVSFLGGNTVFFKRSLLTKVGGWDENSLTEDADIGLRLTLQGAKTKVIYDEKHVTKEETPSSVESFIRQRTRWNQGFLQMLLKGDWRKLQGLKQKLVTLYVLSAPVSPIVLFIYIPLGIWVSLTQKFPVVYAMFTYMPFYVLFGILSVQILGLWQFTRTCKLKFYWYMPIKLIASFFPYIGLLTFSALRAIARVFKSSNSWEKTSHLNLHREKLAA